MTAATQAGSSSVSAVTTEWLARYKEAHGDELASDAEFARWLEEDYTPIAGGWHY